VRRRAALRTEALHRREEVLHRREEARRKREALRHKRAEARHRRVEAQWRERPEARRERPEARRERAWLPRRRTHPARPTSVGILQSMSSTCTELWASLAFMHAVATGTTTRRPRCLARTQLSQM
jgi:hypothetical protein